MFVFIIPFLVGPAAGGIPSGPTILVANYQTNWTGLLTFLNTEMVIWLKYSNQSLGERVQCVRWKKMRLTGTDYIFTRYQRLGTQTQSINKHAVLLNVTAQAYGFPSAKPALKILDNSNNRGGAGQLYIMEYWDWTEKCALFFGPGGLCQQYVWYERVQSTPVCDAAYRETCRGTRYEIYKRSCNT
ncbi:uncharacterized protein LOC119405699 [Rhipicephalus sanguineus]|uniref:uncharacterized protein LOC119405699 n=1 Tax=Rhipicephalus sanguineus TaxID=34632 RepID=UPI0020C52C34|nr:uncharacterized protein LOC119405699 [Rhipicephalus sanguineus]